MFSAEIILDSVSPAGARIRTFLATYPRSIHDHILTHRDFSRNSRSNRAVPFKITIQEVIDTPYIPDRFAKNCPGMSGREYFFEGSPEYDKYKTGWLRGRDAAVENAKFLAYECGAHKEDVNYVLEPYQWITTIITTTRTSNSYAQRLPDGAHHATQRIFRLMHDAEMASTPVERQIHAPFTTDDECQTLPVEVLVKVSAARCGRISYLLHPDGAGVKRVPTIEEDIARADRFAADMHWSPLEHAAFAAIDPEARSGNFTGWIQNRKTYKGECR